MSIRTRVTVLVSTLASLYANRYREKMSIAVITALYPHDGSSNGTMSIWSASAGPIANCDISIKGGVMLLFGVLFVWAHSLQSEMWLAILAASPGKLYFSRHCWVVLAIPGCLPYFPSWFWMNSLTSC